MTRAPRTPLKFLTTEVRDTVDPQSLKDSRVFHYSIPVLDATGDGTIEPVYKIGSNKLLLNGGEVLVSKLNPRITRVLESKQHDVPTVASTEFIALIPDAELCPRFLCYWLMSETTRQHLDGATMSVTRSHQRVRPDILMRMHLDLPPEDTQRAIVAYLDTETSRIDSLIGRKLQMIGLVNEHWQAYLNDVFTKYPIIRLKRLLAAPLAYGVLVPDHDPTGIPMLRIMDLGTETIDVGSLVRISRHLSAEYRRTVLEEGDIAVSIVGTLGRSVEVTDHLVGFNLNRALARVRLVKRVPRSIVRFWFQSNIFQDQARVATSSDSAQPTLGLSDLKNFTIGIPTDRQALLRMAKCLEQRSTYITRSTSRLQHQIALLQERRQALITTSIVGASDILEADA